MQKGKGRGLSKEKLSEERTNEKVKLNQLPFLLFSSPRVSFSEFKWRVKKLCKIRNNSDFELVVTENL